MLGFGDARYYAIRAEAQMDLITQYPFGGITIRSERSINHLQQPLTLISGVNIYSIRLVFFIRSGG